MNHTLKFLFLISLFFIACEDETPFVPVPEEVSIFASCCSTNGIKAEIGTGKIYVPNIITPNNDGINDKLGIFGNEEISIINKFEVKNGDATLFLVENFSTNNGFFSWDGTDNNSIVSGVFSIILTATDINGTEETLTGEVCVLPCGLNSDPVMTFDDLDNCQFGTQHDGEGGRDGGLPSFEELECLE